MDPNGVSEDGNRMESDGMGNVHNVTLEDRRRELKFWLPVEVA